ncbi:hypothetical protein K5549_016405, partial [Capra hircus]
SAEPLPSPSPRDSLAPRGPAPSPPIGVARPAPPVSPSGARIPSTFWGPQVWDERPQAPGLVSWAEPEQRPEASAYPGSPQARRVRPGSPDLEWGLQPRVTLEQISAFWRREGRSSVG